MRYFIQRTEFGNIPMKSSENGGTPTNWSLARSAGLGVGLSCLAVGLANSGMFGGDAGRVGRGGGVAALGAGASLATPREEGSTQGALMDGAIGGFGGSGGEFGRTPGDGTPAPLATARPVRNVPLDFSVVFAAAASPGESDVAGLMADTNFDGVVDGRDVEDFVGTIDAAIDQARRTGFGGFSPRYDLNDDGRLDERDLELYLNAFGFGERGPRFKGVHLVKC